MEASGICSEDVNPRDGFPVATQTAIQPLVLGHESISRIVTLGPDSTDFKVGDRVGRHGLETFYVPQMQPVSEGVRQHMPVCSH